MRIKGGTKPPSALVHPTSVHPEQAQRPRQPQRGITIALVEEESKRLADLIRRLVQPSAPGPLVRAVHVGLGPLSELEQLKGSVLVHSHPDQTTEPHSPGRGNHAMKPLPSPSTLPLHTLARILELAPFSKNARSDLVAGRQKGWYVEVLARCLPDGRAAFAEHYG